MNALHLSALTVPKQYNIII